MALVAGDTNTLNATNAHGCFVVGTKGDVNIFGQVPTDLFGMPLTAPELKFYDLKNAIVDGEPDIARLLSWRYRLVEKPYGRQTEIDAIIRWAESDDPLVLLRMVEGPGGSGKTRLAAEAALALKDRDWQAGFLPRSGSHAYTAGKKGLLLIVDYPEEQPERIRALIDAIRDRREPPHKLRILLLSRRSYEDWSETFAPIREQTGRLLIARLEELPIEDAHTLIEKASNRLRSILGRRDSHTSGGVEKWLEAKGNRLSLYATAAAVHLVLAPDETFGLGARNIMAGLVEREVGRVNEASRKAELGEHALARLLALAPMAGGLTPTAISRLAEPEMQIFECDKYQVMDRLRGLPWWDGKDNMLPALTPDILAALFTSRVLKTPDIVPRWLWATLQDGIGDDFAARVGRVIHDIDVLDVRTSELPNWLEQIPALDKTSAIAFLPLTLDDRLPHRLAGLAAAAGTIAGSQIEDEEHLAIFLNNASVDLSDAGRDAEALAAAARAVAIRERLAQAEPARFEPDLASSLSNLASYLGAAGRNDEALAAATRALDIYERLAQANPARFEPYLAVSLNNLANHLSDAGRNDEALVTVARAVAIRERLAQANPARFEPDLASSLNNLANRFSKAGRNDEALAAAARAVDIRERLAQANPARFEPNLASSLNNLAIYLGNAGRNDEALAAAARTVDINERLAQANPARFEPDLASSLNTLANRFSKVGRNDEALAAAARAVDIYERLAQANPGRFEPDLATALTACMLVAERAQDAILACQGARRALPLWRQLVEAAPLAYLGRLLQVLRDCARIFAAGGMEDEADEAAAELKARLEALEKPQISDPDDD